MDNSQVKTYWFSKEHVVFLGLVAQEYSVICMFSLLKLSEALVKSKQTTLEFQGIGFPKLTRGKTLTLVWSADHLRESLKMEQK